MAFFTRFWWWRLLCFACAHLKGNLEPNSVDRGITRGSFDLSFSGQEREYFDAPTAGSDVCFLCGNRDIEIDYRCVLSFSVFSTSSVKKTCLTPFLRVCAACDAGLNRSQAAFVFIVEFANCFCDLSKRVQYELVECDHCYDLLTVRNGGAA